MSSALPAKLLDLSMNAEEKFARLVLAIAFRALLFSPSNVDTPSFLSQVIAFAIS